MKPANIGLHIGRRPILAFGNSDGDLAMLRYCKTGKGARLALLIHHDDAEREVAYDREFRLSPLAEALDKADDYGITVVSMKKDWKTVFAPAQAPAPAGGRMKEWLVYLSEHAIVLIDFIALIVVVIRHGQAVVGAVRVDAVRSPTATKRREVWLRYARWLVAGLTFQLAADIIETSITTSWEAVGRIAADRGDPHLPQLFPGARSRRDPRAAARRREIGWTIAELKRDWKVFEF